MFTSFHSGIGSIFMLIIPNKILAGVAAILSHHLVDMSQEKYPKSANLLKFVEGIFLVITLLIGLVYENFWLILAGIILGNLMDIIDKFRHYVLKKPEIFPCHSHSHTEYKTTSFAENCIYSGLALGAIIFILEVYP